MFDIYMYWDEGRFRGARSAPLGSRQRDLPGDGPVGMPGGGREEEREEESHITPIQGCPGTVDYPAGAGQPEMAVNLLSKRIVLVPPSE